MTPFTLVTPFLLTCLIPLDRNYPIFLAANYLFLFQNLLCFNRFFTFAPL